jgi:integrase
MPKIVEGMVSRLKVPAGKRDIQVFDSSLPGFGIRKFETGKAFYFVKFTVGAQQRKLSLGPVVPGVLGAMRRRASEILMHARVGRDLVGEKRAARTKQPAVTFGELVPRYLRDRQSELRDASYVEVARYLERYWQPLHGLGIDAIQRRDVVAEIDRIADAHGKVSADRARTSLSAFFAWAIDRGYLDLNPVQNIQRRAQGAGRTRVLTEAELVEVWKACGEDDYGRIVRLLILTGQRKTEIGDLSWPEVDLEKRQLDLPAERTKNKRPHLVPLSDEALAIVRAVLRFDTRVFLFGTGSRGFQGWSKAKQFLDDRIDEARASLGTKPISAWTIHDLRRSVVTHLHERGFAQPHAVEAIVNHVSGHRGGVAGVYNKALYLSERRKALDIWGQHLTALLEKRVGNVVPMRISK